MYVCTHAHTLNTLSVGAVVNIDWQISTRNLIPQNKKCFSFYLTFEQEDAIFKMLLLLNIWGQKE